ncbi:MAG: hypothetical protein IJ168_09945 [Eubacterium sp.]|nr:hypothetical protein [Eubacterium sp.]
MTNLSGNEIADAKRRVEEMRRRAQHYEEPASAPSLSSRTENILELYDALNRLLQQDRRDLLTAVLLQLAAEREEDVVLLTLLGILL